MVSEIRLRGLGVAAFLAASICLPGCGDPLEAPFTESTVPDVDAGAATGSGGGGLPPVPAVLFPTTVEINSSADFVRALGFLLCKLEKGCCGLSLADPDIESICASSIDEAESELGNFVQQEATGLVKYSPENAATCASMLLGYLNQLVNSGFCTLDLETLASGGLNSGSGLDGFAAVAQQSGIDIRGLLFAALYCQSSVFLPAVAEGGSCAYTDTDGDVSGTNRACGTGYYCRGAYDSDAASAVCTAEVPLGGACENGIDDVCGDNASCRPDGASNVCRAYKEQGEACDATRDVCRTGECTNGVCDAQYLRSVGEFCTADANCASAKCSTESSTCLPRVELPAGSACADLPADTACAAGLVCDEDSDPSICVAPTAHSGDPCGRDADCIGGACLPDGTCAATMKEVMCAPRGGGSDVSVEDAP